MKFREIKYENLPHWDSIEFSTEIGTRKMEVNSADMSGDVEIEMTEWDKTISVYLTQENIKQLITHLQKQLK